MVELKNVSVTYSSGVDALNNVSLKINDGDFAFVVGSSGAGKSTMIKLLLKEIDATSGVVTVNGYNLNKLKKRKIPEFRRTLGFVFQDFRLIPSMTVYENIAFVLRVIDAPIKYIRKRVPYVISLVGLHAKTNSYPDELSGGEKQRVAIARALVNDPQLIIADEPTGNIDPELSYEIVELLKGINDQGTTILMVTHEHDLVRHFGGRIINITEGEIVFDEVITGTGDELLADMNAEVPAEAVAEAISEAEQINSITGSENTGEAAELPIEDMSADDIISAIGGIPEPEQAEKELMKPVAENIDVDITQELPKIPDEETPEQLLAALSEKTEGGAE
ncbi:MAG: cell division ATP-binding protein FtsE [Ruminococcus sp.]|uniref:cell division ATP-binding protein FtsE n=1 Tax=Ruminococcus sp. TaxID=41978 RepID=UPI001B1FFBE2|nr:cell division ATP-binding protein FtsE [Ruminococcus sp.]